MAKRLWPVAVLALLSAGGAGAYVQWLYVPALNTPYTPITGIYPSRSQQTPTPALARRIAFLMVDGLAFEKMKELPELEPLRKRGVARRLRAEFPTYTSPGITSMMTGLSPRDSGMRINGEVVGPPLLEATTEILEENGVGVRAFSRGWTPFGPLVRSPTKHTHFGRFGQAVHTVLGPIRSASIPPIDGQKPSAEVTFVYVGEVDEAAHKYGMDSEAYQGATRFAGSFVARYAASLDPAQDALVVVSDHGHIRKGGHGGTEEDVSSAFFLATGWFVRFGAELEERPMRDVAPTLAVVAGIRPPRSSLGRPMLDALALDDEQRAFTFTTPFDGTARFLCKLAPAPACDGVDGLTTRLRRADSTALLPAAALLDQLEADREAVLASRTALGRRRRLLYALGSVLALLAALVVMVFRRRKGSLRGSAGLAVLLAALGPFGFLAWRGYRLTFSTMRTGPAFLRDALTAALLGALLATLAAAWRSPGRLAGPLVLASAAMPFALVAAYVGANPHDLPPPRAGIAVLLLLPHVVGAALAAVLLGWLEARRSQPLEARALAEEIQGAEAG